MSTIISDAIEPAVFDPYVVEKTADFARFYMGGIVQNDAELNALATAGGRSINMPFWHDLTGPDEVLSDSSGLTLGKITAGQDVATLLMRGRSWGVNDLAKSVSGDRDVMAKIGNMVADYWARKYRDIAISSLDGVIASNIANNAGDMVKDVSGATNADISSATKFSADAFIDGQSTFGDAFGGITGIGMHPDLYYAMMKLDPTSFEKESMGDLMVTTYRGLRLIVDRKIPFTPKAGNLATDAAPMYTTYLFGNGAFGLGQGAAPVPSETARDADLGIDKLYSRSHILMHLRGFKHTGASVAGSSPTNAELANGANHLRVYERENVRIAAIITNG